MKSVYSPNSIIRAVKSGEIGGYWTETETYESLKYYIGMNEDGLKDAIISMLGGMRKVHYDKQLWMYLQNAPCRCHLPQQPHPDG